MIKLKINIKDISKEGVNHVDVSLDKITEKDLSKATENEKYALEVVLQRVQETLQNLVKNNED